MIWPKTLLRTAKHMRHPHPRPLELPTDFKNLPGQLFGEKLSRLNHL